MNTKKRTLLLTSSIFALSSAGLMTGLLNQKHVSDNKISTPDVEVTHADGILITNKSTFYNEAQRTNSIKLTYTISPATADDFNLTDTLTWSTNFSYEWESETWGSDEDPSTYVSHSLDTANKEITLTCLKPFGRSMNYTITCLENTDVKASINIDYVREMTKNATASFANTSLEDGKSIDVNVVNPTYSIGSKGAKQTPTVEVKTTAMLESTWDTLFPEIDLSGCSDTGNLDYDNGSGYTTMKIATARNYMKQRAQDYLLDVIRSKGSITFSREKLINILTYKKKPNPYAGEVKYTVVGETFIKRYKQFCASHANSGIMATLYVNGSSVAYTIITLNVKASEISNINVSETQVDF